MVTKKNTPPESISFQKDNFKRGFEDWNKKNNNALTYWLSNGQMLKIDNHLYIEKGNFQNIEKQLSEYLKILDVNIFNINTGKDKEILYYCNFKENKVKQLLKEYFSSITNKDTFIMPFSSLCGRIIQQPIFILDAVKKYPDNLNKEQTIYYRHKFIHSKIKYAIDKFTGFNIALESLFNSILATSESNKPLLNLFLFTDQFINELKFDNPTGVNYFETPLFIEFFKAIIRYKKRYVTIFGEIPYENINEIETILNNSQTQQNEKPKPELTINQIALKYTYEGLRITRENSNDIAKQYGHNSGEKLFQKFTYYSSLANRKGKPTPLTPKKLDNKIKLIESIIELLPTDKQERAKDEVSILKKIYQAEYQ